MPRPLGAKNKIQNYTIRLTDTETQMLIYALKAASPSPMDVIVDKIEQQLAEKYEVTA
jgi:hypothetical protein